jgi:hypothetical protein
MDETCKKDNKTESYDRVYFLYHIISYPYLRLILQCWRSNSICCSLCDFVLWLTTFHIYTQIVSYPSGRNQILDPFYVTGGAHIHLAYIIGTTTQIIISVLFIGSLFSSSKRGVIYVNS